MMRYCVVCGKTFDPEHVYQAACSMTCDASWEAEEQEKLRHYFHALTPKALEEMGYSSVEEFENWQRTNQDEQHIGERVYFLQQQGGENLIKIGFSTDISRRIQGLQTASAYPLELLGSVPATRRKEQWLHARLADAKVFGEWFAPTEKVLGMVNDVCNNHQ